MTSEAPSPYLDRFRDRIARHAAARLAFVRAAGEDFAALDIEFPNLLKALALAFQEPAAWATGVDLAVVMWPFVDARGHWPAWQPVLTEALALAEQLNRPLLQAQLLDQLGELARIRGDSRDGLQRQERSLRICREVGARIDEARALRHLAIQRLELSRLDDAEQSAREAVDIFRELAQPAELASALNTVGIVCERRGQWDAALAYYEDAVAVAIAAQDPKRHAHALHNQAVLLRQLDHRDAAEKSCRLASTLYAQAGDLANAARANVSLGMMLHAQGRTPEALELHKAVEAHFRTAADRPWLARVLNNEGVFHHTLGDMRNAARAYEEAADLHMANSDANLAASSLLNWAELLLDQGQPDAARIKLQEADILMASAVAPPKYILNHRARLQARAEQAAGASTLTEAPE